MLQRQPYHRRHIGNDEDDVLGDLGPRHRAHATEKRTHQNAAETDEHTDAEFKPGKAGGDQAHAVDLRHDVRKRAQNGGENADAAHDVAAVAFAKEVGNGELAKFSQIGRQQKRDQTIAAGPAHHKRQAIEAGEIQCAGHADERRSTHPVGTSGHAVEKRRNTSPCDIIFGRVHGTGHDADRRIERNGGEQEPVTDPLARHAHLFRDGECDHESEEANGVEDVVFLQLAEEGLVTEYGFALTHSSSPSCTPYSISSLFM